MLIQLHIIIMLKKCLQFMISLTKLFLLSFHSELHALQFLCNTAEAHIIIIMKRRRERKGVEDPT